MDVAWDLDADGEWDDAAGAEVEVAWGPPQDGLEEEVAHVLSSRAVDGEGEETVAETTLTVRPPEPEPEPDVGGPGPDPGTADDVGVEGEGEGEGGVSEDEATAADGCACRTVRSPVSGWLRATLSVAAGGLARR